jgi:addiction module RelE/StbE family toxin
MAPLATRWTRQAIADLDQVFDFVATTSPQAARAVIETIDRAVDGLTAHPRLGRPGRVAGTRELAVPRTPYLVAYRLDRGVEILAVIHGARRWPEAF